MGKRKSRAWYVIRGTKEQRDDMNIQLTRFPYTEEGEIAAAKYSDEIAKKLGTHFQLNFPPDTSETSENEAKKGTPSLNTVSFIQNITDTSSIRHFFGQ